MTMHKDDKGRERERVREGERMMERDIQMDSRRWIERE